MLLFGLIIAVVLLAGGAALGSLIQKKFGWPW